MRRSALALLAILIAAPQPMSGQTGGGRTPRRWIYTLAGAAAGAVAAGTYAALRGGSIGMCSNTKCVSAVSVGAGAVLGFLVGRELDRLHALRYRHGRPISLGGQRLDLALTPLEVRTHGPTVAVAGEGGVEILRDEGRLVRVTTRGRGLRGVQLAQPGRERVLVGTSVGLYDFPLGADQPLGTLLAPGEVSALDTDADRVLVANGRQGVLARLEADSLHTVGRPREFGAPIMDVAWDASRAVAWVLTEAALVATAVTDTGLADSLGAFALPGPGRRLAARGDTLVVAAGEAGVFLLSVADPRQPVAIGQWSGARFAYDAVLLGNLVYVAAGPEGLYVLEPTPHGALVPRGLDRHFGFVSSLHAANGELFVVDRAGRTVHRVVRE
jgi:hypothetical protein